MSSNEFLPPNAENWSNETPDLLGETVAILFFDSNSILGAVKQTQENIEKNEKSFFIANKPFCEYNQVAKNQIMHLLFHEQFYTEFMMWIIRSTKEPDTQTLIWDRVRRKYAQLANNDETLKQPIDWKSMQKAKQSLEQYKPYTILMDALRLSLVEQCLEDTYINSTSTQV